MSYLRLLYLVVAVSASHGAQADDAPAKGKFLVATELVRGSDFEESVILLLHHDESGAAGLIVNKPLDVAPVEALPDLGNIDSYDGTLFFGGPVELFTVRALMMSDSPPQESERVIGDVYLVPVDEHLLAGPTDTSRLRFYIGYAGWSPGQLERELERGSWHVTPARQQLVFDEDSGSTWRRLAPAPIIRASITAGKAAATVMNRL
jgi:putative transcriptional regulator